MQITGISSIVKTINQEFLRVEGHPGHAVDLELKHGAGAAFRGPVFVVGTAKWVLIAVRNRDLFELLDYLRREGIRDF
jgi:hypothetical protein